MATGIDIARGDCRHEARYWGHTAVVACGQCGVLEFFGKEGPLDPAEGVAALFGSYDLIGPLPAVGAPAPDVLAYRPPITKRRSLELLPLRAWLRVSEELWIASGGDVLLLATTNQLMVRNLTREA